MKPLNTPPDLHPAQNRGLRELYATARQLAEHWESLAERLPDAKTVATLNDGIAAARDLLRELPKLTEPRGLYGGSAAHGVGRSLARSRGQVGDRFLERNQALRTALLDVQHVVTLLGYQAEIASSRGDDELAETLKKHERKLLSVERAARRAAVRLGRTPDDAVTRLDPGLAGRVAHGAANAVGTVGEWVDGRRGKKKR